MNKNSDLAQTLTRILTLTVITVLSLLIIIPVIGFINNARVCDLTTNTTTTAEQVLSGGYVEYYDGSYSVVLDTVFYTTEELSNISNTDFFLGYIENELLVLNKTFLYVNIFGIYADTGEYYYSDFINNQTSADTELSKYEDYSIFYFRFAVQDIE